MTLLGQGGFGGWKWKEENNGSLALFSFLPPRKQGWLGKNKLKQFKILLMTFAALLAFCIQGSDSPAADLKDETLIIRQKNFLYIVIDDIDKSILYMAEDISDLESRIGSITLLEPAERDKDMSSTKSRYERHMKRLYKMKDFFEQAYSSYFTDALNNGDWAKRFDEMVKYYEDFRKGAIKGLAHYEKKKVRLVYFLNRQRFLMTETEALRNEITRLEAKKDVSEEDLAKVESRLEYLRRKLWAYQVEMNAIARYKEEMYLHYLLLIEQLRDKGEWLVMKIEEYQSLSNLAAELDSGSGGDSKARYKAVISKYEKEISFLKGKIDVMGDKEWSVVPFGEIRDVERFEELADYYKLMKSRYGDYKKHLDIKMDGFRADMVIRNRN